MVYYVFHWNEEHLITAYGGASGAAARPMLKMIHRIIFRALRPPSRGSLISLFLQIENRKMPSP